MRAILLTIGDELLIGQVINTNAAWLGETLSAAGVDVTASISIGDDEAVIEAHLERALQEADLVVVTGGLGPTHDDVTRTALAHFFGVNLRLDEDSLERIRSRFRAKGRSMPERNQVQAMAPENFDVLPNPVGTAPGMWWSGVWSGASKSVVVLPGVPFEMKYLVEHELLPRVRKQGGLRVIRHRTLLTTGIGESNLQEMLGDLSGLLGPRLRLAYLPGTSGVRLRITAYGETDREVDAQLDRFERHIYAKAERFIFGRDDDTLEKTVGGLIREAGLTVSVAESCTGGYILNRMTNVSGASAYVVGGVVAYHNEVKVQLLGIAPHDLEREGAVSEAVALQMATGVRKLMGTDVGVSITGIAGPSGGTPEKPVGTVWIGYADASGEAAYHYLLAEERLLNKELSSTAVLGVIRRNLLPPKGL